MARVKRPIVHPPPPKRYRPGTGALREIRRFQKSVSLLIPRAPFGRLIKATQELMFAKKYRWTTEALLCAQEAAEIYLVNLLADSQLCAVHAKRVTLMPKDIHLGTILFLFSPFSTENKRTKRLMVNWMYRIHSTSLNICK